MILARVCQHLIRNCDKTRLRKKAGLPVEEEGGEVEDGVAKEWTQARNLEDGVEEVVEEEGEEDKDKLIEGEEEPGEQRGEQESWTIKLGERIKWEDQIKSKYLRNQQK